MRCAYVVVKWNLAGVSVTKSLSLWLVTLLVMKMGNYSNKVFFGLLTIVALPIKNRPNTQLSPAMHFQLRRRYNMRTILLRYICCPHADHQNCPQHMLGLLLNRKTFREMDQLETIGESTCDHLMLQPIRVVLQGILTKRWQQLMHPRQFR